jgi:hypothetical protein
VYGSDDRGFTDDEIAHILGWTEVNKARKRCSDLRNEGMIEPIRGGGITRTGSSGMQNEVCCITDRGIATLASMKEPHAPQPDPVPVPTTHVGHVGPLSAACPICRENRRPRIDDLPPRPALADVYDGGDILASDDDDKYQYGGFARDIEDR